MALRYIIEAVRPSKLDHISMAYIYMYMVTEHEHLLLLYRHMDAPLP
jgi:hypothetical protein